VRPVRAVLLDVDDTLVDTRGAFTVAWRACCARYLPHADVEAVVRTWRADAGGHYAAYAAGRLGYEEQRHLRVNALHAEHGGPQLDEAGFAAWNALFESAFRSGWRAFDDAGALLAELAERGVPVGMVTNAASDYQRLKLRTAGLPAPEVLVGVDVLGVGKPDPRVFLEGARRLGLEPGEAAYVGDELHVDALGAQRAGLQGVWLDRPGARHRPVAQEELDAALASGVRRVEGLSGLAPLLLG